MAIFTDKPLKAVPQDAKKYTFNTEDEINVGDYIKCSQYHTPIQITNILTTPKKLVNKKTGKLTNRAVKYGTYVPIKNITIVDPQKTHTIVGYKKSGKV